MKNIVKIIFGLPMILVGITFLSCDFLNVDSYFMDTMKEDSIFHTKKNADGFLWNTPSLFPDPGAIWGSSYCPGELASDELVARWKTSEFPGLLFTVGEISSEYLYSMNIWGNMYKVINRCNEMLGKVNTVPNMTTMEVNQY
ncbi:MAG: RagB/SusD family nutrient uptake outer membrane protein, partial [Paludibacter sp.]|nr:RagB/SusD family nutrient uptake outer membrane protein [Paludibacter sp.]